MVVSLKKYTEGGDKKELNISNMVFYYANYFTVGVKNETDFKSFDACHATRHTGSWDSTNSDSQVKNAIWKNKEMLNRDMMLF